MRRTLILTSLAVLLLVPAAAMAQPGPSVGLAASASQRDVGQKLRLTVSLSSSGPGTLIEPRVKVSLPHGLKLLAARPSGASLGILAAPALAPGQTIGATLITRVTAPGSHTASATLSAASPFVSGHATVTVRARARPHHPQALPLTFRP